MSDDLVELSPVNCAALVAPAIDRTFTAAMALMPPRGGGDLVRRYGGPEAVGALIEFRTSLGWPGRAVTPAQAAAVTRYRDADRFQTAIEQHAAHGTLVFTADAAFRATDRGREFLGDVLRHQGEVLADQWQGHRERAIRLNEVLGRLLDAATETADAAFEAMTPVHEPPGTVPEALLLNRLGTLRYHRADAHAAAWTAAGLTAAEMVALPPGDRRDAIEDETNRLAAAPYAVLNARERLMLLADLAALP